MNNTLFVLCEDVTVDGKTNQWTFFKHIEKINLAVPKEQIEQKKTFSVRGKFNVVTFWRSSKEETAEIKYLLTDESGDVLLETPGYKIENKKKGTTPKHRLMLTQLPVKSSGEYYLELYKRGEKGYKKEAEILLTVEIKEKEEKNTPPEDTEKK